jgi:hypothetical protein
MQAEVAVWERDRNNHTRKIVWQFTTSDARIKVKRLCPNKKILPGTAMQWKETRPLLRYLDIATLLANFLSRRDVDPEKNAPANGNPAPPKTSINGVSLCLTTSWICDKVEIILAKLFHCPVQHGLHNAWLFAEPTPFSFPQV